MEEIKQKKSTFEKVVIAFNVIAIIFMVVIISNVGIVEECTNNNYNKIQSEMELLAVFNQEFTTYEGIRTGSQIKALVETVNVSNVENEGTDLIVEISGDGIDNSGAPNNNKFTGGSAKKYKVAIEMENGAVSNINIYKINTQNVNNNVSTNYTEFAEIPGTMQEGIIAKVDNSNNSIKNNAKYKIDWDSVIFVILLYSPVYFLYLIVFICNKFDKKRILKKYHGEECQKKLDKANTNKIIAILIIAIIISMINFAYFFLMNMYNQDTVHKPIIYIYPEEETEVTVELGRKENLTCTYPLYEDKWEVTATPDGTLIDEETGRTYYALYWEGINSKKYGNKLEEGFVVKGEDTIKFLEEKLEILGLNEKEAEEFIVYWLPKMQNNKYNYIRFQTIEEINENMPLKVTPEPDTLVRVMLEWKGLNKYIEVEEQQLEKAERKGYTVVEWGGTEIK